VVLRYLIFDMPQGWVGVLGTQEGLRRLVLPQPLSEQTLHLLNEFAVKLRGRVLSEAPAGYFGALPERIKDYLNGKLVSFPDKLDLSEASPFQKKVWQVDRSIPYGETRTYAWVANQLGMPKAARAVGQALAKNPLPIIIPCHRVICSSGDLGGFSGGIGWKQRLLEIEAEACGDSS
jgi:methylated-DNA-[protein]-cysteine S-methyltransferase